jgi:hypothetical protein
MKTLFTSEAFSKGGRSATNRTPNGPQDVIRGNLRGGVANRNAETKP